MHDGFIVLLVCMCCCCCCFLVLPALFAASTSGPTACFPPHSLNATQARHRGNQSAKTAAAAGKTEGVGVAMTCAGEIVAVASRSQRVALFFLNETTLRYDAGQSFAGQHASMTCDGTFLVIVGPTNSSAPLHRHSRVRVYAATGTTVTGWFEPLQAALPDLGTHAVLSCRERILIVANAPLGHVIVHRFNGTHFARAGRIAAFAKNSIGSVAVSCAGHTLAVALPKQRTVVVYDISRLGLAGPNLLARLEQAGTPTFGESLALAGSQGQLVAVGAPNVTAVYIHTCSPTPPELGSNRTALWTCHAHDLVKESHQRGFGRAVAMNGNGARLLIGAWSEYKAPGNATLYIWNDPQQRYLPAPSTGFVADAELGCAVALGHAGREFVVAAGGTATRRIAAAGCWQRAGRLCPAC